MVVKRKKKGRTLSVDWSDVEIKNILDREGEFLFKVTGADLNDDETQLIVQAEVISEKYNGKETRIYFNLSTQSLWFLRRFLEAAGVEVPDEPQDLDLDDLIDLEFVGRTEKHEYDDKTYHRVRAFDEAENFEGEVAKTSSKAKAKATNGGKKTTKTTKVAKLSQDDINDMDEDELAEIIEEHDLDVDLDDYKTLRKKKVAIIDAAQEAELLSD